MDKQDILKKMGGIPEDVYDSICETFYAESKERMKQIAVALENSDLASVAKLAHGIKGSSANLYIQPISELALKLESAAKSQDLNQAKQLYQSLQTLI